MADLINLASRRGPTFPPPDLLREAAALLRKWAHDVMQASEGDVLAWEACVRADDLDRMADRLEED